MLVKMRCRFNSRKNYEMQVRRKKWGRGKQQGSLCGCSGIALVMDSTKKGKMIMMTIIMTIMMIIMAIIMIITKIMMMIIITILTMMMIRAGSKGEDVG